MPKWKRKQRQANRQAKRAKRGDKFRQTKFYQALHKEKPKGFRGHQAIAKSKTKGLHGKLGLKEKIQDLFTKDGHQGCPTWGTDKNGNKVCLGGDGGSNKTTATIDGNKYTTSDSDEKKKGLNLKGLDFSMPQFVGSLSMGFKGQQQDAMGGFGGIGARNQWRQEEKKPAKKEGEEYLTYDEWTQFKKAKSDLLSPDKNVPASETQEEVIANEPTFDGTEDEGSGNTKSFIKASFKKKED